MRGLIILLGLLLMLGGGAVAGAQFAPIDLSTFPQFDQIPGSREFLKSQMALYAGGGAAGFGFLLVIMALATGGKKKREKAVVKSPSLARETIRPPAAKAAESPKAAPQAAPPVQTPPPIPQPLMATAPKAPPPIVPPPVQPPKAAAPAQPAPVAAAPPPRPAAPVAPQPAAVAPAPPRPAAPQPVAPPVTAAVAPRPAPPAPAPATPTAKPQASAQPPADAVGAPPPDPRVVNRKRIQDLVTINDALKAYQAKNGAFPKADGLAGANERGAGWIPGLSPDFLPELPRDPLHASTTQYVYASDGTNYKLLAQGASLVGSMNVEVLGIKIDPTRNPTQQSASFGFWTPAFAGA